MTIVADSFVLFSGLISDCIGRFSSPSHSIFSGADHIDHVSTQIPYALTSAAVALVMYMIYGLFQTSPLILIPAGLVILYFLMNILSKMSQNRYNIHPETKRKIEA